ncbi:MAG: hypothetical protein RLZZ522_1696 [Verrucomicrobiota bacterium]
MNISLTYIAAARLETHAIGGAQNPSPAPVVEKRYPDFRHALGTQHVCDAVLESARTKQWVDVKQA